MFKQNVVLTPEEANILVEYLSHYEQDIHKYKDMKDVYEKLILEYKK